MGIVTIGMKRFRESKWDLVKMKKLNDQTRGERTAQELEAGRKQIPWFHIKSLGESSSISHSPLHRHGIYSW